MSYQSLRDFVAQYKALLLDSDGTIGNTERVHAEIGAKLMTDYGVPTSTDERFRMKGYGEARIWDEMQAKGTPLNIPREDFVHAQTKEFVAYIQKVSDPETIRRPGMLELIQAFRDAGKPVAVVSNTPTSAVEALKKATGLSELIDLTITYDDVVRMGLNKKPSPDPYDYTRVELGLSHNDLALIIEDSPTGAHSGLAACGFNHVAQITYDTLGEVPLKGSKFQIKDSGDILGMTEIRSGQNAIVSESNDNRGSAQVYDMPRRNFG